MPVTWNPYFTLLPGAISLSGVTTERMSPLLAASTADILSVVTPDKEIAPGSKVK